ncbi:MAG: carboxylating nicotinate-nucleotide diphosphorylase [Acidimicrobiia bacterium]
MSRPDPAGVAPVDPPRHLVREAVTRAIAEDLGPLGDITAALLPADAHATADVVVRAHGVLAGSACATEAFAQIDPQVDVEWRMGDGSAVSEKEIVATVGGSLRSILTAERTALNFLCHLSGVASATRRFVDALHGGAHVADTRKTLPGLRALEKAAVRAGGGVNHRGSLSDMVLVKDNHLGRLGIAEAVERARSLWPGRGVEVECERVEQVVEALEAGADVVMLDNMTPVDAAGCVAVVRGSAHPDVLVELSGGVTLENIHAYADAGVDVVSTSAITQSAPALDIALDLRLP